MYYRTIHLDNGLQEQVTDRNIFMHHQPGLLIPAVPDGIRLKWLNNP